MTDGNQQENSEVKDLPAGRDVDNGFGSADKSLSDALKMSFFILKIIMFVLLAVFLLSGFRTVEPDEEAIVLWFGKIRGVGENRILKPGLHLLCPYPIHEIKKIPVTKKFNITIDSFWYYLSPDEIVAGKERPLRPGVALNPIRDGYCMIRSEKQTSSGGGFADIDYNIIHSKWEVTYQITDPEKFYKNVYVDEVKPGQSHTEVIKKSITPMLKRLVEDSIVTAMVNYTIDEAILSKERIPRDVKVLLGKKLAQIDSGITAVSVMLTEITWPRQVDMSFQASIAASQASQKSISEAKTYAENTLNETAGPIAEELLAVINGKEVEAGHEEYLWTQLAGAGQQEIALARAYRTSIVETAKANAEYLNKILPEYRKRPKLVIHQIYQDTIEHVMENSDEKIIIQPTKGSGGREIRILLNRDPTIKPKKEN